MGLNLAVDIQKNFAELHMQVAFELQETSASYGIFGASGSGKSTLINMLAGLLTPDSGSIVLDEEVLFDSEKGINLPPEKRGIGVVFQHAYLFPHLNVEKNLFYGQKRRGGTINADLLIDILGLKHLLKRDVESLSGGEKQRVALGRTILSCPKLILLDEPLTGLDSTIKYQIIPYLQQVFEKFSIPMLFVSHDLQEMRLMTDQVIRLEQGHIKGIMAVEDLALEHREMFEKGYVNILSLTNPKDLGKLYAYSWGANTLMVVQRRDNNAGRFGLDSRDIILFKMAPEAASARNMLPCTVRRTYESGWMVGVELDCNGETLIAEIVAQSVNELGIEPGAKVVAVMKASAIHRIY